MIGAHIVAGGLVLDIIGVVLLFRYGLPADVNRHGGTILLGWEEEPDQQIIKKAKHYDKLAWVALGTLVTGFLGQMVGNYISAYA